MTCKEDIHTLHAELIHKARDVEFQIAYMNGILSAAITDIGQHNVQFALESYWSKVGIPVKNEIPIGSIDGVNLSFLTMFEFVDGTLEVFLDGLKLNGNQTDAERDFDVISVGPNTNKGFTLLLDSDRAMRLHEPPCYGESLIVSYGKRITFNTKGGT